MSNAAAVRRMLPALSVGALLLCLLALQQIVQVPGISIFAGYLQNALHVPFFFVVTGLGWYLGRPLGRWRAAVVGVLVVSLAGITELLQGTHGRLVSVEDFLRNLAGVAAALCWFAHSGRLRPLLRALSAVLIVAALAEFLIISGAYLQRWWQQPQLFAAEEQWSRRFVWAARADIEWETEPAAVVTVPRHRPDGRVWWSIHLDEVWPDWTGYERLCLRWSSLRGPQRVYVGVKFWPGESARGRYLKRVSVGGGVAQHMALALNPIRDHLDRDSVDGVAGVVLFGAGNGIRVERMWLATDHCGAP